MRIFITWIVTSVYFAGASHRLFAGEYLEAALGVCIAVQMWIIEYLDARLGKPAKYKLVQTAEKWVEVRSE